MKGSLTALVLALALTTPAAALPKKAPVKAVVAAPKTYFPPEPPAAPPQLHGIQYLYGSAEAAALTRQTWRMLADFVDEQVAGGTHKGVVLTPDSTLTNPHFLPCGDKPPAIVLDVDETAILNLGAEAALNAAGLGPARHGETLFLSGDDANGSFKDGRRQVIAARYCVLAMAGDQLVDFSDLFTTEPNGVAARRATVAYSGIADLWGNGWFVMPNPVYGSALQGGADEIFPKDKQWRDPGPPKPPEPAPAPEKPVTPKKAK